MWLVLYTDTERDEVSQDLVRSAIQRLHMEVLLVAKPNATSAQQVLECVLNGARLCLQHFQGRQTV